MSRPRFVYLTFDFGHGGGFCVGRVYFALGFNGTAFDINVAETGSRPSQRISTESAQEATVFLEQNGLQSVLATALIAEFAKPSPANAAG